MSTVVVSRRGWWVPKADRIPDKEITDWLDKNTEYSNYTWLTFLKIEFKNEEDATAFKLRFGS